MSYNISFEQLEEAYKEFSALKKAGLEPNISFNTDYDYNRHINVSRFDATFNNITTNERLAELFSHKKSPFIRTAMFSGAGVDFLRKIQKVEYLKLIDNQDSKTYKQLKYLAITPLSARNIRTYMIINPPYEFTTGGKTYRVLQLSGLVVGFDNDNPVYNYLDKGHVVCMNAAFDQLMVSNECTLEVSQIFGMFGTNGKYVISSIGPFINSATAKLQLLKLEKSFPEKTRNDWKVVKQAIQEDFEQNAQNVLVSKLSKGELETITLNEIKITKDKAIYAPENSGEVSIDAKDLMKTVFTGLINPNDQFDIYMLINTYTDWIEAQLDKLPLNLDKTGFAEAKTFTLQINGFTITVGVCTTNTRRRVNDFLINKDELSRVMRRASCFTTIEEFTNFVQSVSSQSLYVHDVLSKGLPIKILPGSAHREADETDPKLFFKRKNKKYYLILEDAKKERLIQLKRFISFCYAVETVNTKANGRYSYVTLDYTHKDHKYASGEIKRLIREYAVDDVAETQLAEITDDILDKFMTIAEKAQKEAQEKSEKLLEEVVKSVAAEKINWRAGNNGRQMTGYKVKGNKKSYFVESKDNFQVFDFETGRYICIVNRGEPGAGMDGLVTRLLALKNDSLMSKRIHTLSGA